MSEVYSFRLSNQRPRETKAIGVINDRINQGYSLRYILTEALLLLGNSKVDDNNIDDVGDVIEKLSKLVERMEGHTEVNQTNQISGSNLSSSFVSSIKLAVKPGIRFDT
jgi:hypothetical protein